MSSQSAQQMSEGPTGGATERSADLARLMRRLHTSNRIWLGVLWIITGIVALAFISIIVYLLQQGFTALINPVFYGSSDQGIGPELFNTFYILIFAELLLFPISLAAAIYLIEYARQGLLVTVIHFAAETLAGVPSIVLGLFGFIAFGVYAHFGTSRLTGALTVVCLNLPIALRLLEDALASVPQELREGSLALGTSKWRMIRTIVLPSALPGLITGLILSAGKIIGEAAALIFTMGAFNPANPYTLDPRIASDNLTIHLWFIKTQGAGSTSLTADQATAVAAGSAALLILILLIINLLSRSLGRYIQRRITAA